MLPTEIPAKAGTRRYSLTDQARALAVVLQEEFEVPFAFYDAVSGEAVPAKEDGQEPAPHGLPASVVTRLAADGRASVTPLTSGCYQLAVLLYEAGKPVMVAVAEVAGLAQDGPEGVREQARLRKWLQAVSDRLRLADQLAGRRQNEDEQNAQVATAWEAILTLDQLARRLRIHKEPVKNQQRILDAAFSLLGVQTLLWVPQHSDSPVIVKGDPCLAPPDCRQLAAVLAQSPESQTCEPILCNEVQATGWGARFPGISSVLAFIVTDQVPLGWVIAINKKCNENRRATDRIDDKGPLSLSVFRKSDAGLLTPFVALLEMHARGATRYQDLKELLAGLTRSLTAALDAKDSYTFGHSERVARIAVELGREMGLQADELGDIYLTGLLHDVGKIGIRDAVLGKKEKLTAEEFDHIKQHVTIGYAILADLRPIRNLLPGVLYHHERIDGTGYPDGLSGEAIPLLARILAVADAYDAMSTSRPYRDAMACRRVEETLTQGAGTQWDKRVIEAFTRCRHKIHAIRQRGVGDSLRQALDGAIRNADSSFNWKSELPPRVDVPQLQARA